MLALNEKVDHLKEEKSNLESQLAAANTTIVQLQRENASLLVDLTDCNRKVLHAQEVCTMIMLSFSYKWNYFFLIL